MIDSLLATDPRSWEVSQVLVLDWYDGPRMGFCLLTKPPVEFYFELLDERPTADGLDDRLFSLKALAPGSVAGLLSSLSLLGPHSTPIWIPSWTHSDSERLALAGKAIEAVRENSLGTNIVIRTSDFRAFSGRWVLEQPGVVSNWFEFLGI